MENQPNDVTSKRKLRHQELFNKFEAAAREWLTEVPEARGLTLLVDWNVGQNDFPPCFSVTPALNEEIILGMIKQSIKFTEQLVSIFSKQVESVSSKLNAVQEYLRRQQEQEEQTRKSQT